MRVLKPIHIHIFIAAIFSTHVIYNGSKTIYKAGCSRNEFSTHVIYNGSKTSNLYSIYIGFSEWKIPHSLAHIYSLNICVGFP
jgi:hypothetical protein